MALDPGSREKTGFITHQGKFVYKCLPMGLVNAPASFQCLIDTIFSGIHYKYLLAYLDDLIIYSRTFSYHDIMQNVREVLSRLEKANLKLKPTKCSFGAKEVTFLRNILSSEGLKPAQDKVSAIQTFPVPHNVKQVRRVLGMLGYYRKFISKFGQIAKPL